QARAASTADGALLDFARDKFYFEPPPGLKDPDDAPRRLALVPTGDGRWALAHSLLKLGDTRGRRYSFFSHVLFTPGLTLHHALRCWASLDWQCDYETGRPKALKPLDGLTAGPLDDDVLLDFLHGAPGEEEPPSRVLCPARLPPDARKRQTLMAQALQGVRLVLRGDAARFYVVAESGLVALLLYG